jgi:hypothetical protein
VKIPPLLSGFYQVCYVTGDLDAAVRRLGAVHGIERFRIRRDVDSLPGMPKMSMDIYEVTARGCSNEGGVSEVAGRWPALAG